ncbi:hypothetical protein BS78_09G223500 [Paspalum vaginatum]|nr:hypothetical protein BS78_09G223500 [Paspalum vaginatum]
MAAAESERKRTDDGDGAKGGGDDDSHITLSLGGIYSNAPAAMADAADDGATGFRSPVTPAPLRPSAAPTPTAAVHHAPPPPLRFDAPAAVVQGIGGHGSSTFLPAASALTPTQMALLLAIDGGVPTALGVHGIAPPPAPTPPAALLQTPVQPPPPDESKQETVRGMSSSPPPPPPAKRSRSKAASAKRCRAAGRPTTETGGVGLLVPPPYPWSTDRACVHRSLAELSRLGIDAVSGELQCRRCDRLQVVALDVQAKFRDLCGYISRNIQGMNDRAPKRWQEPALPDCDRCGQKNSMRPLISADKESKDRINWVFLLLTEMLGLCTLEQLKYFCAHTRQHRTGAKDRVLYSTYMELCNQLLPGGIFDMASDKQKRIRLI